MMRSKILLPFLGAGMLVCLVTTASAQGVLDNQRTFFTFSAPVALPGTTLPAGKYEFKLAGSQVNRQIVQVFNSDSKIVATIFSVPALRNDIPNDPEVRFLEAPANTPPAVKTWWYPGSKSSGHEFIYPKAEAQKYAQVNSGVLASSDPKGGDLERLSATTSAKFEAETVEENAAGTPQRGEVAMDTSSTATPRPAPVASANTSTAMREEPRRALPSTAGASTSVLLAGLVALAAGLWVASRRYGFGH